MKLYLIPILPLVLSGCINMSEVNQDLRFPEVPENWHQNNSNIAVTHNWVNQFNQPMLGELIDEALSKNYNLRQQAYNLQIMQQRLIQADAELWPELDLKLSSGRSHSTSADSTENNSSVSLSLGYEIDLWGKLSAAQQQSHLTLQTAKAEYQQSRENFVAGLVSGWFDLISSKQLFELFEQRVDNAKQNLDIIKSGYQQGLNGALDVYLSRNELNSELSNLAKQETAQIQSARNLELLLGRYPNGQLINKVASLSLPMLTTKVPLGLPSELISRKPELVASWYQVLAQDAGLAFAHKQRFPSINLSASVSDSENELSDLLSKSSLGWSLLGNLTAPLFQAGKLKANEEIARLQLKQQEQIYLDTLYKALANAENAITTEQSLKQQYQATLGAQKNAKAAETLAFEQYQRGLVTYTTVLDAQARSINAQSTLIQINNQLLSNRVDLHIALGGRFSTVESTQAEPKQQNSKQEVKPIHE